MPRTNGWVALSQLILSVVLELFESKLFLKPLRGLRREMSQNVKQGLVRTYNKHMYVVN